MILAIPNTDNLPFKRLLVVDRSILIRMDAIPISKNLKKALPEIASHLGSPRGRRLIRVS